MKRSNPVLFSLAICGLASADVAFDNFGPGGIFTGNGWLVRGPLVSPAWTHAFPVVPTISGEITSITVSIFHLNGATNNYTFELRSDAGGAPGPSLGILGQTAGTQSLSPPAPQFSVAPGISITAGTAYWVYAHGEADANGTWLTSPTLGGTRAYSLDGGQSFTVSPLSPTDAQGAIRIEVTASGPAPCYANCDNSTTPPILNIQDFTCFLNRFAAGESYANCDDSTTPPVLNIADFTCFLNAFAAGCS